MIAALIGPTAVAKPMPSRRAGAIDAAVRNGMARTGTQGMAIAAIENGRVVMVRAYGIRDRGGAPLQTDTIMYGASLTKAVFAYTVQRLAQEGSRRRGGSTSTLRSRRCCPSRYPITATSTDTAAR